LPGRPASAELEQPINHQVIHWSHTYSGHTDRIRTSLYSNQHLLPDNPNDPIDLVLGYGEKEFSTVKSLEFCAKLGVPAIATVVDMEQVEASTSSVEAYATNFLPTIIPILHEEGILSQPVARIIGHSMGGGILGLGLAEAPELFDSVGFAQSLGMDTSVRKAALPDDTERLKAFTHRFARVVLGLYAEPSVSARLQASHDVLGQLRADSRPRGKHGFRSKADLATNLSAVHTAIEHAGNGHLVVVFTGTKDPLVRTKEVIEAFQTCPDLSEHITTEQITTAGRNILFPSLAIKHAYMGWRTGNMMLQQIITPFNLHQKLITLDSVQNTNSGQQPESANDEVVL
jgi:pimeloyl-ACP methyl ester carboxylesterase